MIKKLIVNADDIGISEGATLGIIKAHREGILTSTTCMMNMPYAIMALNEAKKYPDLGVGVHLVATIGKPLTKINSYVEDNGDFIYLSKYPNEIPQGNLDDLYQEWKVQIETFISIMNKKPTHLDSHHHIHMLPELSKVAIKLAHEYDIPLRQRQMITDHYQFVRCDDSFYNHNVSYEYLINLLNSQDESLEIMCHPALLDWRLYQMSSYNIKRMLELDILTNPQLKQYIKDNQIELINFSNLKRVHNS